MVTIPINKDMKERLDKLKIHSRESYNDLIVRILNNYSSSPQNVDRESLIETIEILSDPETMRNLGESIAQINRGETISFSELKNYD